MELIINKDSAEYTEFIRSHGGNFLQTLEWAKVKADWDNLFFVIKDNGTVRGAGSILIRRLPVIGKNFMYCPRGPVLDYTDDEVLQFFVTEMKELAKKYNAIMLKIDPDIRADESEKVENLFSLGFVRKPLTLNFEGIQPRFVSRLDITSDLAEVMAGFHHKTRYNIRLAGRKGVKVRIGNRDDLKSFHKIMEVTGMRDNFVVRSLAYFQRMYDILVPPGYMRLYIAEHQGKVLSGAISLAFGNKCWYLYGASSNEYRNLMPNYLLQWEMIEWAKEEGCEIYDFRGISGDIDPSNPLYGLYRFKKGFNGTFTEFAGEFDLVFDSLVYKLWDVGIPLLKKMRSKLIMAKKKLRK